MALPSDRVAAEVRILTFADRVSRIEAEAFFRAGGAVLISEYGRETSQPVYRDTTFFTSGSTTWEDLANQADAWRHRYPNQRFYALRPVDQQAIAGELVNLLTSLTGHLADVLWCDRDDRDHLDDRDAVLARTLAVLLQSAVALSANGVLAASPS